MILFIYSFNIRKKAQITIHSDITKQHLANDNSSRLRCRESYVLYTYLY